MNIKEGGLMVRKDLTRIADHINEQHELCRGSLRMTLEHAVKAGELLEKVKREVGHGNFGQWITENCNFSPRTAQFYMQTWHNREKLKNETISDLKLSGAIKLLQEPKHPDRNQPENWRVVLAHTEKNPFMPPAMREWYCTEQPHTQTLLNRLIAKDVQPEDVLKLVSFREHPEKPGIYQQAAGLAEYYALVLFDQALIEAETSLMEEGLRALREAGEETVEMDEKTGRVMWTESQMRILSAINQIK